MLAFLGGTAEAGMIRQDFNSLSHGNVVTNQFSNGTNGFTVSGMRNLNHSLPANFQPSPIVAFDTFLSNTADPDLQDPFARGNARFNDNFPDLVDPNLPPGYNTRYSRFQKALIIQENPGSKDADDEGSRPAGSITFDFDDAIDTFGFDMLDVEGPLETFVLEFFTAGTKVGEVDFGQFLDTNDALFYDSTLEFGDNSANRFTPITASDLDQQRDAGVVTVTSFDRVTVNFGGSGAIDNLFYRNFDPQDPNTPVPEPMSAMIWACLGVGSLLRRRRR